MTQRSLDLAHLISFGGLVMLRYVSDRPDRDSHWKPVFNEFCKRWLKHFEVHGHSNPTCLELGHASVLFGYDPSEWLRLDPRFRPTGKLWPGTSPDTVASQIRHCAIGCAAKKTMNVCADELAMADPTLADLLFVREANDASIDGWLEPVRDVTWRARGETS